MEDMMYCVNMKYMSSLGPTVAYLVLLIVMGLVGNTLVFLVYYRQFKPSVTRTYILVMSVCDLMTNCLAIPSDIYEIRFHYDFDSEGSCKFFGYVTRVLALFGGCILIAVAVDRRRKICQITKTPRVTKHVCVELFLLGVCVLCFSSTLAVLKGLQTIAIPKTNITGFTCFIDDVHVGSVFHIVDNAILGVIFIICAGIFITSYALIAQHVWRHKRRIIINAKLRQNRTPGEYPHPTRQEIFKQTEQEHAGDRTRRVQGQQAGKDSANIFTSERSEEDVVDIGPAGKQHINITGNSENMTLHLIRTVPSQTGFSDVESSDQQKRGVSPAATSSDVLKTENQTVERHRKTDIIITTSDPQLHTPDTTCPRTLFQRKKQHSNTRGKSNLTKKIPMRTTLMMFVVTVMFVVSYLPYIFMAAIYRGKDIVGDNFWVLNLQQIAFRSFFINSAVNPLVYCFCSVRFRRECYLFLCRK